MIFAESTPSFTLGDGSVNDGYLHRDGVHLTHAAVNRLAKNLRLKKRNDASGVCSGERKPQHQHPHPPTAPSHGGNAEWTTVRHRGRQARHVSGATRASCYFCGEEGLPRTIVYMAVQLNVTLAIVLDTSPIFSSIGTRQRG